MRSSPTSRARLPLGRPRGRELELGRRVLTLVIAIAVGLAILAAAALVLAGLVATWAIWIVVGWCFFGRRFHAYGAALRLAAARIAALARLVARRKSRARARPQIAEAAGERDRLRAPSEKPLERAA